MPVIRYNENDDVFAPLANSARSGTLIFELGVYTEMPCSGNILSFGVRVRTSSKLSYKLRCYPY